MKTDRKKSMYNYKNDENLYKIYNLIKKEVNPSRIILFGSRARGENHENSDYDLLLLTKDEKNEREITRKVNFSLFNNNITVPVDLIASNEKNYQINKEKNGLIYKSIESEGIELQW